MAHPSPLQIEADHLWPTSIALPPVNLPGNLPVNSPVNSLDFETVTKSKLWSGRSFQEVEL